MSEYIGMRIIPRHDGVWDIKKSYEPLVMVLDRQGDSYMSRRAVPEGIPLSDDHYWALCQRFSAQLEEEKKHLDRTVMEMQQANVDTLAEAKKRADENIAAINKTASDTVAAVNQTAAETVASVNQKTDAVVADTKKVQEDVIDRMARIEARQDANVSASTDSNADYAAEVVDARVDVEGHIHASLGERIQGDISGLRSYLLDTETFTEVTQDNEAFEVIPGQTVSDKGIPTNQYTNFVLFQLKAARDFSLYFDMDLILEKGWGYVAIGYEGVRYRYQLSGSDRTLPTRENKLHIKKGKMLYVSVYSKEISPKTGGEFSFYWNYPGLMAQDLQFNERQKSYIEGTAKQVAEDTASGLIDYLDKELVERNRFTLVTQDTPIFTVLKGISANENGTLTSLSNYNTYQYVAEKDIQIYFDLSVLPPQIQYIAFVYNKKRYRHYPNGGEKNLPTADNPVSVERGGLIYISVQSSSFSKYGDQFGFFCNLTECLSSRIGLNACHEKVVEEISTGLIYGRETFYVECHDGYFYYYLPTARDSVYLRYCFFHYVSSSTNADGWVQRTVDAVRYQDGAFTLLHPVVVEGEWEMAVRIADAPDFIGCRNHGSEVNSSELFLADGQAWVPEDGQSFRCRELTVIEISDMFDPKDETTKVGRHFKEYRITKGGLDIHQRIEWLADEELTYSYVCMLPIARGMDKTTEYQITDTCFDDLDYTEYAIGKAGFSGRPKAFKHGIHKYWLRSAKTGVSAEVSVEIENELEESTSFVQNTADQYNKVYFSYCGNRYRVFAGDVWKWESHYRLNISKTTTAV